MYVKVSLSKILDLELGNIDPDGQPFQIQLFLV
ncbi:hypothetical protein SAN_1357 [Streptococcus agalactiae COH1]|nr:hypothetical protein SAN_1357 [Streptococcus agalactiae COH1]